MAIKVYGDKVVFPDSTEQTTAYSDGAINNVYTKDEMDAQQQEQDDAIEYNAVNIGINKSDIEFNATNIATNSEDITENTKDIAKNTADIAENAKDIEKNKDDIEDLQGEVDLLTGAILYKGSLNASAVSAPTDAINGDMWVNEYNIAEPATNYPVASGWAPVTEVKYDDKLIKSDAGWDKVESVVGIGVYTSGEVDELLDEKADRGDSYLKAEADALLEGKSDVGDSYTKTQADELLDDKADKVNTYTKTETYSIDEADELLDEKADKETTYTKTEIDDSQELQDIEISKKAFKIDVYTKDESDATNEAQDVRIKANEDAIEALPSSDDYYDKIQTDTLLDSKANVGDSYLKAETYSNVEVDSKLYTKADKADTYTKAEINAQQSAQDTVINSKAGEAPANGKTYGRKDLKWEEVIVDAYTRAETDTKLAGKENKGYGYSKSETDTKLGTKANTGVSYTKTEANNLLAGKENKGYGYSKAETNTELAKKANNGVSYTKAEADAKLAGKASTTYAYSKAETDTKVNAKANNGVSYTKAEANNLLNGKANNGVSYTKAEANNLLNGKANTSQILWTAASTQARRVGGLKVSKDAGYAADIFEVNPSGAMGSLVIASKSMTFYAGGANNSIAHFDKSDTCQIGLGKPGAQPSLQAGPTIGVYSYNAVTGTTAVHHFCSNIGGVHKVKSYINATGILYNTSAFNARGKSTVKPIESALEKVNKLKPITYDLEDNGGKYVGFDATELKSVLKDAVEEFTDKNPGEGINPVYDKRDKERIPPQISQGIAMEKVVPFLTKAIQELSEEATLKDNAIKQLTDRLTKLEEQLK